MGSTYSTPTGMITKERSYKRKKNKFSYKLYKQNYLHVDFTKEKGTLKSKKRKIKVANDKYISKMIKKFNL